MRDATENGCDENTSVWICTLSQYQPKTDDSVVDVGPTVGEQLALDPFNRVIESLAARNGTLVAVHTSKADLYRRLWCDYELWKAIKCHVNIRAAASQVTLISRRFGRS